MWTWSPASGGKAGGARIPEARQARLHWQAVVRHPREQRKGTSHFEKSDAGAAGMPVDAPRCSLAGNRSRVRCAAPGTSANLACVSGRRPACQDSLAEWSKAPDSSSGGAIRVGSNPTAVILGSCWLRMNAGPQDIGRPHCNTSEHLLYIQVLLLCLARGRGGERRWGGYKGI